MENNTRNREATGWQDVQEIMDGIWKNTQKEEENTKELQNISVLTLKKHNDTSVSLRRETA